MIFSNLTPMILINVAQHYGRTSDSYIPSFALHSVALGQAIGTFIGTFILNGYGEWRVWFSPFNCGDDATIFEGNCW